MESMETLTAFLGWCSAINIGILLVAWIFVMPLRGPVSRIHSMMFGLDEADLARQYFQYLAQYKIVIFVFNLAPYLALRIIA